METNNPTAAAQPPLTQTEALEKIKSSVEQFEDGAICIHEMANFVWHTAFRVAACVDDPAMCPKAALENRPMQPRTRCSLCGKFTAVCECIKAYNPK